MEILPEEIIIKKNAIRQYIKSLKAKLTPSEKSEQAEKVFQQLELTPEFQQANTIFLYWSLPDELPTHDFIHKWKDLKTILLPVIEGDDIFPIRFESEKGMQKGMLGIMEPDSKQKYVEDIQLILIPGIAFDQQKNRLGRGKGYYDRFLRESTALKIGICYDFQLLDTIPIWENDMKMDWIITPKIMI